MHNLSNSAILCPYFYNQYSRLVHYGIDREFNLDRKSTAASRDKTKSPKPAEKIIKIALETLPDTPEIKARIQALKDLHNRCYAAVKKDLKTPGRLELQGVYGSLINKRDSFVTSKGFDGSVEKYLETAMRLLGKKANNVNWIDGENSIAGKDCNKPAWCYLFEGAMGVVGVDRILQERIVKRELQNIGFLSMGKMPEHQPTEFFKRGSVRIQYNHAQGGDGGKGYMAWIFPDGAGREHKTIIAPTATDLLKNVLADTLVTPTEQVNENTDDTSSVTAPDTAKPGEGENEEPEAPAATQASTKNPGQVVKKTRGAGEGKVAEKSKDNRPPEQKVGLMKNRYIGNRENQITELVLVTILQKEGGLKGDLSSKPSEIVAAVMAAQEKVKGRLEAFGIDGIVGKETIDAWKGDERFKGYFEKPEAPKAPPPAVSAVPSAAPGAISEVTPVLAEVPKLEVMPGPPKMTMLPEFYTDRFFTVNRDQGIFHKGDTVYLTGEVNDEIVKVAGADGGVGRDFPKEYLRPCTDEEKQDLYIAQRYEAFQKANRQSPPSIDKIPLKDLSRALDEHIRILQKDLETAYLPKIPRSEIYIYNNKPVRLLNWTPEGVADIEDDNGKPAKIKVGLKNGKPNLEKANEVQEARYIINHFELSETGVLPEPKVDLIKEFKPLFDNAEYKTTFAKNTEVRFLTDAKGNLLHTTVDAAVQPSGAPVAILGVSADGKMYTVATENGVVGWVLKNAVNGPKPVETPTPIPVPPPAVEANPPTLAMNSGGGRRSETLAP